MEILVKIRAGKLILITIFDSKELCSSDKTLVFLKIIPTIIIKVGTKITSIELTINITNIILIFNAKKSMLKKIRKNGD